MATVAAEQPGVKLVVIEAATVIYVDYTGSGILMQAVTALRSQGIDVAVARLSDRRAQAAAQRCGLIDAIGSDHVFKSVYEAITALG
jgi:anti-anti-sigma regulatory factor